MFENVIHEVVIPPVTVECEGPRRYLIGFICVAFKYSQGSSSVVIHTTGIIVFRAGWSLVDGEIGGSQHRLTSTHSTCTPAPGTCTLSLSPPLQHLHRIVLLPNHCLLLTEVHWHPGLLHRRHRWSCRWPAMHRSSARCVHLLPHLVTHHVDRRLRRNA